MTVTAQTSSNSSTGNGVTTVFPYTFKIIDDGDIEVRVDGVLKTLSTHYTVSGVGDNAGGNVTMLSAPANGAIVARRRNMALVREVDYQYQGTLPAAVLNPDQDAPVLMAQQLQEQIGRSLRGPAGETWSELAAAADRLDLFPVFDATTGALELSTVTQTQVASAVAAAYAAGSTADAVTFLPAGTGAVARTVQAKLRESVSVLDFGAVGDGVTDDTVAIQAAIDAVTAAGGDILVPVGTFMVTALTIAGNVNLHGPGAIKQIASTSSDMITISGTSVKVGVAGVTLDGNQTNQTAETNYATCKVTAVGTASAPAVFEFDDATFINGRWADITTIGDALRTTVEKLHIRNCKFLGGREGTTEAYAPRYIDIRSCVDYFVTGCALDFMGTPAAYGRAGILAYDGVDTTFLPGRGIISGNHLVNIGRSEAASTLGAIDLYDTGRCTSITGNTLVNPYGRGIQCKADSEGLSITGNVVDGLLGGSDGTMNAQIVINASTRTAFEGSVTISGNTCVDSGKDGISATLSNSNDTGFATGCLIIGNTIKNAERRAIGAVDIYDITIIGNTIEGTATDAGIYVQDAEGPVIVTNNMIRGVTGIGIYAPNSNGTASLKITGNVIEDCAGRGIYVQSGARGEIHDNTVIDCATAGIQIAGTTSFSVVGNRSNVDPGFSDGGSNTGLYVGRNHLETALTTTAREVTIASGVITVSMDYHWVDTEGDAATDDLTSISGGWDGQIVTLRPVNDARTVVLKDGSGLRLNGDFTMDSVQDTITLRYYPTDGSGVWAEIARSDNGA